jgi:hypothetical protein
MLELAPPIEAAKHPGPADPPRCAVGFYRTPWIGRAGLDTRCRQIWSSSGQPNADDQAAASATVQRKPRPSNGLPYRRRRRAAGWTSDQVTRTIRSVTSRFSNGTPFNFELVAAGLSGKLAYTVGYERSAVSFNGGPVEPNTLRVTHIYRRENGDWKLVHRHGDHPPIDQNPPAEAATQ